MDAARDAPIGGQEFVFKIHPQKQRRHIDAVLFRKWIHSHEEDQPDIQVFRSGRYAFPPSRGRRAFDFREDGSVTFADIAPADGHAAVDGYWYAEDDDKIFVRFIEPQRNCFALYIQKLGPDALVVQRFF